MIDRELQDNSTVSISPIEDRGDAGPAEFYEVDLHVHTPGSHDYREEVSADEFVKEAIKKGLDLIAITDHDCPGWYEEISEAAQDTDLTVLPGVEITTAAGSERNVHMTAIFPPDGVDQIENLLHNIGINPNNAADDEEFADEVLKKIYEEVRDRGGLPILAHIDEKCGAAYELVEGKRNWGRAFDSDKVAALEATQPEEMDIELDGWPVIRSSDAHETGDLGSRRTYIKMATPSFEGLELAFQDPESRISHEETVFDHPFIEGIKWEGGFLDGRHLKLSRNLNALIGGKGAGKSTIIEHLRYAFDIDPIESLGGEYESLIESTLAPSGEIEVHVTIPNEAEYAIRREYGEDPQIYSRNGENVPLNIEQFREEYFDIAVYSQKEFIELARDDRSQMELLDEQFALEDRKENISEVLDELEQNGTELQRLHQQAENLKADITELGKFEEELRRMESAGIDEYVENQDAWDEEQRFFDRRHEILREVQERIAETEDWFDSEFERLGTVDGPLNEEIIRESNDIAEDIKSHVTTELRQLTDETNEALASLSEIREEWEQKREQREQRLEDAAEEIESDIDVNVNDYLELKKRVEEQRAKEERFEEIEDEIYHVRGKREQLLTELEDARSELTSVRETRIAELNQELDDVQIELKPNRNRSRYKEWLVEILSGSNVHTEDREKLAKEFDPQELAEIVRKEGGLQLEEVGLTSTAARNVIAHNELREALHELEIQPLEDVPVIRMKDRGDFKPLDEISEGQKCTALLSITLHEREDPIIIDEPEDNLDNASIFDTVVQLVREIKHERQFIIATHNANIPVLGDAEMIAALKPHAGQGFIEDRGPIEHEDVRAKVQAVLEGGPEAFRKRSERYGYT
jgi:ABC-type lipoprotein export system ATPase subunit/histidinol phosphatase-like PHP family hydrolase